jgi:hypothetical protein
MDNDYFGWDKIVGGVRELDYGIADINKFI